MLSTGGKVERHGILMLASAHSGVVSLFAAQGGLFAVPSSKHCLTARPSLRP